MPHRCPCCADRSRAEAELDTVRKERDALAAALELARKWVKEQFKYWYSCIQYDEGTGDPDLIPERKVQIDTAKKVIQDRTGKAILAARDAALVKPLVDLLREWSRLADHLGLSTQNHRNRTRSALAQYNKLSQAETERSA